MTSFTADEHVWHGGYFINVSIAYQSKYKTFVTVKAVVNVKCKRTQPKIIIRAKEEVGQRQTDEGTEQTDRHRQRQDKTGMNISTL